MSSQHLFTFFLGKLPDECKHPPSEGPCKAAFPRWYYSLVKRKCKEFLYGGCDGNANNFQTEAACKSFCMQQNISTYVHLSRIFKCNLFRNASGKMHQMSPIVTCLPSRHTKSVARKLTEILAKEKNPGLEDFNEFCYAQPYTHIVRMSATLLCVNHGVQHEVLQRRIKQ